MHLWGPCLGGLLHALAWAFPPTWWAKVGAGQAQAPWEDQGALPSSAAQGQTQQASLPGPTLSCE